MAQRGRKPTPGATTLVQLTLPREVDAALERISKAGFYGRSKSEVVVALLLPQFERIAERDLLEKLKSIGR